MKSGYYIIGRGGLYSIIIDILGDDNFLGYFDDKPQPEEKLHLGKIADFFEKDQKPGTVFVGMGALKHTLLRESLIRKLIDKNRIQMNAISAGSHISRNVALGVGNIISPLSNIGTNVKMGNANIVFSNTTIEHDSIVGNNVNIAPGVSISGKVKIEDNVFIGTGASIVDGITIGKNAVIGAGSLVLNNVEANAVYYGNPAVFRKTNDLY